MKSDVFKLIKREEIPNVLSEVERFGEFCGLTHLDAMKLRLLAEEMFTLTERTLTAYDSEFYVEHEKGEFSLHMSKWAYMNRDQRDKLISVSSTQQNARNKGFFGKLAGMMESIMEPSEGTEIAHDSFYAMGAFPHEGYAHTWSLRIYEAAIPAEERETEWDGLEKSILMHVADDIVVGARGDALEITVKVTF